MLLKKAERTIHFLEEIAPHLQYYYVNVKEYVCLRSEDGGKKNDVDIDDLRVEIENQIGNNKLQSVYHFRWRGRWGKRGKQMGKGDVWEINQGKTVYINPNLPIRLVASAKDDDFFQDDDFGRTKKTLGSDNILGNHALMIRSSDFDIRCEVEITRADQTTSLPPIDGLF